MAFVASSNKYRFVQLVFFVFSSDFFHEIQGLENQQEVSKTKSVVINHELCHSCGNPNAFAQTPSLNDVNTYSELKYDPRGLLPSQFTICASVLVTTENLNPSLFTLLGNDGQPWFSATIFRRGTYLIIVIFFTLTQFLCE